MDMASLREVGETSRSSKLPSRRKKTAGSSVDHLPARIFATNRYPPDGRINAYSKPEYLLDLVQALEGTPEFEKIMESPFGSLFQLPVRKSSLSGKLVHSILSRGLVTEKEHEMWFVFGGYPIRFSLREFAMVTGLQCGPFPSLAAITEMQTPPEGERRYWDTLICSKNATTVQEIVNILKRDQRKPADKKMPGWRRLRLALVVIVEGILICGSQPVRASVEVVEMVRNLDSFMAYPWGRESFQLTLRMIKVGSKIENIGMLVDKFLQSHTVCHGFPLAIQLLILRSIPLLEQYIPDEHEGTFAECEQVQLRKIKCYHNKNIMLTESDPELEVESILQSDEPFDESSTSWPTNSEDPGVDYLLRLIDQGHQFRIDEWQGGYIGCALLPPPLPKRVVGPFKPWKGQDNTLNKGPKDDDDDDLMYEIEVINHAHTMEMKKWFESQRSILKAELKREILEEIQLSGKEVGGNSADPKVDRREDFVDQSNVHSPEGEGRSVPVDNIETEKRFVLVDETATAIDFGYLSATDKIAYVLGDLKTDQQQIKESYEEEESGDDSSEEDDGGEDEVAHAQVKVEETKEDDDCVDDEGNGDDDDEDGGEDDEARGEVKVAEGIDVDCDDEEVNSEDGSDREKGTDSGSDTNINDDVSGQEKSSGEGLHLKDTTIDGQVSKRGTKRSHDPVESKSSIRVACRPKRPRVVPSRFRSPIATKRNSGQVCGSPDHTVYTPLGGVDGPKQKKFLATLAASRNKEFVVDGHPVKKSFFKGLHTPQNWVDTTQMEAMLSLVWRKLGDVFLEGRIGVLDTWFTKTLANELRAFKKHPPGNPFPWHSLIKNTVRGVLPTRASKMMWYRDVDIVYAPMNWANSHWVALAVELKVGKIHILDPLSKLNPGKKMNSYMAPIAAMLPVLIRDILSSEGIDVNFPEAFVFERVDNVSQNERTGDCGPLAVKFIELDAQGYVLDEISDDMVDQIRMKYAVDIYEEFVHSIDV